MPYVLPGDTATRRLRGEFIRQNFPLPYSSLGPAVTPHPAIVAKGLAGLGGTYVPALWQEPPYRQGVDLGLDVAGFVDWVKSNPLIFAGVALVAVLALKGKRRR